MRWVLTWKDDPAAEGGKRVKARLVVFGFGDLKLCTEEVNSPALTRRGRALLYQTAVNKRWRLYKADAKAAFLRGEKFTAEEYRYAAPVEEFAKALGTPLGEAVRLEKPAYGLTRAPKDFYLKVDRVIVEIGSFVSTADLSLIVL